MAFEPLNTSVGEHSNPVIRVSLKGLKYALPLRRQFNHRTETVRGPKPLFSLLCHLFVFVAETVGGNKDVVKYFSPWDESPDTVHVLREEENIQDMEVTGDAMLICLRDLLKVFCYSEAHRTIVALRNIPIGDPQSIDIRAVDTFGLGVSNNGIINITAVRTVDLGRKNKTPPLHLWTFVDGGEDITKEEIENIFPHTKAFHMRKLRSHISTFRSPNLLSVLL